MPLHTVLHLQELLLPFEHRVYLFTTLLKLSKLGSLPVEHVGVAKPFVRFAAIAVLARAYEVEDLARAFHPETAGFHLMASRFHPKVAAAWAEAGFYRRMNQKDNLLERARRAYACRCNRTAGIIYQRGSKSFNRIDEEVVIFDSIRGELAPHKSGPPSGHGSGGHI